MNKENETDLPIVQLALGKKLINKRQLESCRELVKKSKRIGLVSSVEEVLVKQGMLSEAQVQGLKEICLLAEKGMVFGVYRLGRLIGEGGMGKVYEAVHEIMGRSVALKVISAQIANENNNAARFYQEIRAIERPSLMDKVIKAAVILLIGTIIFCIGGIAGSLGWIQGINLF